MRIEINRMQEVTCSKCGKSNEGVVILLCEDKTETGIFLQVAIEICEGCISKIFKQFKKET